MLNVLLDARRDGPMATGTFDPLLFGIFIAIAIAVFIGAILLLRYIYKDAVHRGLNAELWIIIILLAPIIGIPLYFVIRSTKRT
jgi:beta-lactamase regulating signal transducer with metallopeptidase domain